MNSRVKIDVSKKVVGEKSVNPFVTRCCLECGASWAVGSVDWSNVC